MTVVAGAAAEAAEAGAARTGAARSARAGGAKAPGGVPHNPAAVQNARTHAAKLRADGLDDAKIRRQLAASGYQPRTVTGALTDPASAPAAPSTSGPDPDPESGPETPAESDESGGEGGGKQDSKPAPSWGFPTGGGAGGGLLLGVLLYFPTLALIRGGPAGLSAWWRAKFLNQVTGNPTPTGGGKPASGAGSGAPGAPAAPAPLTSGGWDNGGTGSPAPQVF